MRTLFLTCLLLLPALLPGDGEKAGRRGNALYDAQRYEPAAAAYRSGLEASGLSAQVRYGLENNLGAALLQSGDGAAAQAAFERAVGAARTDAAVAAAELEAALAHYRQALLADPANEAAKFNYEFVKRRMQQQQQQQQQQDGEQNQEGDQQNRQQQDQQQGQDGQQQQQDQQQQDQQQGQDGQQQQQNQQQQPSPQPEERDGQQQGGAAPQDPTELSPAQAERMLQALQNEEEQLLRQLQRTPASGKRVEKDW